MQQNGVKMRKQSTEVQNELQNETHFANFPAINSSHVNGKLS